MASEGQKSEIVGKVKVNGKPVSDAVVYLLPANTIALSVAPITLTIIQEKGRFKPFFNIVTLGSSIRFENHDDVIHNVNSQHPENRFDLGSHMPNTVKEVVLKNPGIVTIRCKVHPEMAARIYVSPSPFYSVTDETGRFKITKLPYASYEIHTWHASLTPKETTQGTQTIEISSEITTVHLDFTAKNPDQDFADVIHRDWHLVIDEIRMALDLAFIRWEKKKKSAATLRVMTARSKLFHESGLRNAIAKYQGSTRAEAHDRHFDQIRKSVQGIREKMTEASSLRQEIHQLLKELMEDAKAIMAF
ncbi:hypothetical protein JYT87_00195 [Nitrospira defluvii]|nr:hypothetical protein [Nitrospira defluvii]